MLSFGGIWREVSPLNLGVAWSTSDTRASKQWLLSPGERKIHRGSFIDSRVSPQTYGLKIWIFSKLSRCFFKCKIRREDRWQMPWWRTTGAGKLYFLGRKIMQCVCRMEGESPTQRDMIIECEYCPQPAWSKASPLSHRTINGSSKKEQGRIYFQ